MGLPVQQGGGHLTVTKNLGPLPEGQIGGDDEAGALVELGNHVEQ